MELVTLDQIPLLAIRCTPPRKPKGRATYQWWQGGERSPRSTILTWAVCCWWAVVS